MDIKEMMQNSSMEVPDHLEMEVRNHLMELDGRKMPSYSMRNRVVKVAVSLMIMLSAIVMISKSSTLESLADKNPIVKALIGWMWEDEGVEYALENDYYNEDFYVVEGDYIIRFYNFTVDEQRLYFEYSVDNPNWPEDHHYVPLVGCYEMKDAVIEYIGSYENNYGTYTGRFYSKDEEDPYTRTLDTILQDGGEINMMVVINDDPSVYPSDEGLDDDMTFRDRRQGVDYFEMKVDISQAKMLMSMHYELDQEMVFDEGTIHFRELIVSPMSMELVIDSEVEEGYEDIGLSDFKIECVVDGQRQYINLTSKLSDPKDTHYSLGPSYFFEDVLTDIAINVTSYCYSYVADNYEINTELLPMLVEYHEIPISIDKISNDGEAVELSYSYDVGLDFSEVMVGFDTQFFGPGGFEYEGGGDLQGNRARAHFKYANIQVSSTYSIWVQIPSIERWYFESVPLGIDIDLKQSYNEAQKQ